MGKKNRGKEGNTRGQSFPAAGDPKNVHNDRDQHSRKESDSPPPGGREGPPPAPTGEGPPSSSASTMGSTLRELKGLLDEGIIEAAEYEEAKRNVLGSLRGTAPNNRPGIIPTVGTAPARCSFVLLTIVVAAAAVVSAWWFGVVPLDLGVGMSEDGKKKNPRLLEEEVDEYADYYFVDPHDPATFAQFAENNVPKKRSGGRTLIPWSAARETLQGREDAIILASNPDVWMIPSRLFLCQMSLLNLFRWHLNQVCVVPREDVAMLNTGSSCSSRHGKVSGQQTIMMNCRRFRKSCRRFHRRRRPEKCDRVYGLALPERRPRAELVFRADGV